MKIKVIFLFFLASLILIKVLSHTTLAHNLFRLKIVHIWMQLTPAQLNKNNGLNDGIPDAWDADWWGGATSNYNLEVQGAWAGKQAVRIENTNTRGSVALTQATAVPLNARLVFSVYSKGAGGAIQVWFRHKDSGEWIKEGVGGWRTIVPSEGWQQYHLFVTAPSGTNEAKLFLRTATGVTFFDDAYAGVDQDGLLGTNLLKNSRFEQDGVTEYPVEWWQSHVVGTNDSSFRTEVADNSFEGLSYLNVVDMLAGRYEMIKQRAFQLGDDCVSTPEMTSWLIARGDNFEYKGGAAARERLYQLAIEMVPNCPQPYAALGSLYESNLAFWRAAELYRQAAELSGETFLAGKNYFAEGFLHVRNTGNMERAIFALQQAEQLSGWEGSYWYWGAAPYYLGQALEAEGRHSEAIAAYQRVLDCSKCTYHHNSALAKLKVLSGDK